ncbi:MAG: 3-dehydroquinate synthase [Candidatus Omnitrophota bacterium]
MRKIKVDLGKNSYNIMICSNEISKLGARLKRLGMGRDAVIITNARVKRLFGGKIKKSLTDNGINAYFRIIPDTEKAKSEKYCMKLLNDISEFDSLGRRVFIVALGGGVVGDLAGFVASVYKRGIPYAQVPTTLLAQVDSAIGGKVAIDLSIAKNMVGAFYQPRLVYVDVSFLKTLPRKELVSGLAEVIKYGVIKSPGLFKFVRKNLSKILNRDADSLRRVVSECGAIKAGFVKKDERDNKGIRIALNLGHTIGHAIETAGNYGKTYGHGQAIALGMLSSAYLSERLGLWQKKDSAMLKDLIKKTGLPVTLKGVRMSSIISSQRHDKKFTRGKNRFVLPAKIGKVIVRENIPESLIRKSIAILYEPE